MLLFHMAIKKDELITGAELARRLKVSSVYITKNKEKLKNAKCMFGKKYYFEKSSLLLGKNPDNPHESYQKANNTKPKKDESLQEQKPKEPIKKPEQKKENINESEELKQLREENKKLKEELNSVKNKDSFDDLKENIKKLYIEISNAIGDIGSTYDKAKLDGLKAKAAALKELELAVHQGIKNKQLDDSTLDKESVFKILNVAFSLLRKSLLSLANNLTTSLEGMDKLERKEHIMNDVNKMLEDFQATGKQFE